eukprot:scaffold908_cov61-Phaeocystis_antarctica.AAC.2
MSQPPSLVRLVPGELPGSFASLLGRSGPRLGQGSHFLSPLVRPRGSRHVPENPQSDPHWPPRGPGLIRWGRDFLNDRVARIAGEARKPKLHTVAEARRISRKAKRLGLLAVQSVPIQRQEEEVLAVGEEEDDQLHADGMRLDRVSPTWLPSLSDDERLVEEHAQSRGVEEPLVVGETRQPHFWWQILRLHWR